MDAKHVTTTIDEAIKQLRNYQTALKHLHDIGEYTAVWTEHETSQLEQLIGNLGMIGNEAQGHRPT